MFLKIFFNNAKEIKKLLSESSKKKFLIPSFFFIIIILSITETSVIGSLYPLFDFLTSNNEDSKYYVFLKNF